VEQEQEKEKEERWTKRRRRRRRREEVAMIDMRMSETKRYKVISKDLFEEKRKKEEEQGGGRRGRSTYRSERGRSERQR